MTKEETAYADTLNLLGSDLMDPDSNLDVIHALDNERRAAEASVPRCVGCALCSFTVPYEGPTDGEHYADLWEHLIARHRIDADGASAPADWYWSRPRAVSA